MLIKSVGISAVIALAAQSSAALAQDVPERATLLQFSVAVPMVGAPELQRAVAEETAKITSCREGLTLGERLKARGLHGSLHWTVRTDVRLAAVPAPRRDALLNRSVGRATPIFGDGKAYRVLVRCEPNFIVPGQVPSPAAQQRRSSPST